MAGFGLCRVRWRLRGGGGEQPGLSDKTSAGADGKYVANAMLTGIYVIGFSTRSALKGGAFCRDCLHFSDYFVYNYK